ncbi:MAG: xylulokinase [Pseudomonadota bacterium]
MYLGLDLGTSGLKALLIDSDQTIIAEATAPLSVSRPHPAWSEQNPDDWTGAAAAALHMLKDKASLGDVRGIGLSGQQHGATILDKAHRPLRPAILWNDTRAADEAEHLDGLPGVRDSVGSIIMAGFTSPKLVWAKTHEPEVFQKAALVLLPKDYLRLWLTGEAVSEPSDASGTGWLDVPSRIWSDALLATCEMTRDQMPGLVEGSEPSGGLRAELAQEFGLPAGVPVAGGGGDNAAAAVGMGVTKPGRAFVSLGTSGVVFSANPTYTPKPETAVHTFCHALPDTWHQMGVILSATDSLNWYAALVGADPVSLTQELGALKAPGRALFMPYLGGERTPINDPKIRAAFIGLGHEADRVAGTRAVLEGVTFAVKDSVDALKACGTAMDFVIAVGGGSRSRYWLEAIATAIDTPIAVPTAGDYGGAFGAARLGALASGGGDEFTTAPPIGETVEPHTALTAAFQEAHTRYSATYQALKGLS